MKLIAFDTSSKSGSIVTLEWDPVLGKGFASVRLVNEWALSLDNSFHSERLLWGIHQVLEASRWKLADLDALGVGVGPGSFTGLRIGITTARTLAGILNKPLIGVSSLAALARPAALASMQLNSKTLIVASSDACKGELFTLIGSASVVGECVSMSDQEFPGLWKRGAVEAVLTPEEMLKRVQGKLRQSKSLRWMAVGEGRHRYPEVWSKLPKAREIQPPYLFSDQVQGRYLGMLVWEAFQSGLSRDALKVHPRYLRASDAEIKLKAGLLPPGPVRGRS